MKRFFLIAPITAASLFLSGCLFMMGDKVEERVRCPKSEKSDDYQIPLKCGLVTSFADPHAKGAVLNLSKDNFPRCSVPYSHTTGASKFIHNTTFALTYPELKPIHIDKINEDTGMYMLMHVGTNCGYKHLDQDEQSKKFSQQIENNIGYTEDSGKHHFAPIVALDNSWYIQENIREGDGNASMYFLKDNADKITLLLGCDRTGSCYSRNPVVFNGCSAGYTLKNVPYQEFNLAHRKIEEFIQTNCSSET